jgi:2-oxoglutarate ferredoxin oxidoreductase subunit alpha
VKRVRQLIPPTEVYGDDGGLLVLGWGSTYGSIRSGVERARAEGIRVGHAHIRHLNPLPGDLGDLMARYDRVIVPELNLGQLVKIIRTEYLIDAVPVCKIQGQPFLTREIVDAIRTHA